MTTSPYVLDNDNRSANSMLDNLSAILDPFTRRRLTAAGIPPGGRCLEIGAGNGSVAAWLADQVGVGGSVVATDVKPHHIVDHPRVEVVKHDIGGDEPLDGPFGLIHARLVLAHLPTRWEIVRGLAGLLRPGGVLVVEDWGQWSGPLLASGRPDAALTYSRYQQTLLEVFRSAGNDTRWAAQTARAMLETGLAGVDVAADARSWTAGTPGCQLPVVVSGELRQPLLAAGLSAEELNELVQVMLEPSTQVLGNITLSTIGYRATGKD